VSAVSDWRDLYCDRPRRRRPPADRDTDAIIRTHAHDRKVAAWFEDTARAFEEIGEIDLAIGWAKQAADFDRGHQSLKAAGYWCKLLAEHRPAELLPARLEVFRRWPSSSTAAHIYQNAGPSCERAGWPCADFQMTSDLHLRCDRSSGLIFEIPRRNESLARRVLAARTPEVLRIPHIYLSRLTAGTDAYTRLTGAGLPRPLLGVHPARQIAKVRSVHAALVHPAGRACPAHHDALPAHSSTSA
jgi:hypothetical protein